MPNSSVVTSKPNCSNEDTLFIPIDNILNFIEKNGLHIPGVFRVPGNHDRVLHYQKVFDEGGLVGFSTQTTEDIHNAAALLKKYLRELPEPLLTSSLYPKWLKVAELSREKDMYDALHSLIMQIPHRNRSLLSRIMRTLSKTTLYSSKNQMDEHNLAIVFGMNLMAPGSIDARQLAVDTKNIICTTEFLIRGYEFLFLSDESEYEKQRDITLDNIKREREQHSGSFSSSNNDSETSNLNIKNTNKTYHELVAENQSLQTEVEELRQKLSWVTVGADEMQQQMEEELQDMDAAARELFSQNQEVNEICDKMEEMLRRYSDRNHDLEHKLETEHKESQRRIKQLEEEVDRERQRTQRKETELRETKKSMKEEIRLLHERISQLESINRQFQRPPKHPHKRNYHSYYTVNNYNSHYVNNHSNSIKTNNSINKNNNNIEEKSELEQVFERRRRFRKKYDPEHLRLHPVCRRASVRALFGLDHVQDMIDNETNL